MTTCGECIRENPEGTGCMCAGKPVTDTTLACISRVQYLEARQALAEARAEVEAIGAVYFAFEGCEAEHLVSAIENALACKQNLAEDFYPITNRIHFSCSFTI